MQSTLTPQTLVHMYYSVQWLSLLLPPIVLHQGHKKQQRDVCEWESSESVWGGERSGGAPLTGHRAVWSECERGETRCDFSRGLGVLGVEQTVCVKYNLSLWGFVYSELVQVQMIYHHGVSQSEMQYWSHIGSGKLTRNCAWSYDTYLSSAQEN